VFSWGGGGPGSQYPPLGKDYVKSRLERTNQLGWVREGIGGRIQKNRKRADAKAIREVSLGGDNVQNTN